MQEAEKENKKKRDRDYFLDLGPGDNLTEIINLLDYLPHLDIVVVDRSSDGVFQFLRGALDANPIYQGRLQYFFGDWGTNDLVKRVWIDRNARKAVGMVNIQPTPDSPVSSLEYAIRGLVAKFHPVYIVTEAERVKNQLIISQNVEWRNINFTDAMNLGMGRNPLGIPFPRANLIAINVEGPFGSYPLRQGQELSYSSLPYLYELFGYAYYF